MECGANTKKKKNRTVFKISNPLLLFKICYENVDDKPIWNRFLNFDKIISLVENQCTIITKDNKKSKHTNLCAYTNGNGFVQR